MRLYELIKDSRLDELKMSPTSLSKAANTTNAIAGMEFEMIVPVDSDTDQSTEPDRSYNPRADYIDAVVDFFENDMNERRSIYNLRHKLENAYSEYVEEYKENTWNNDKKKFIESYIDKEIFDPDAAKDEANEYFKSNNSVNSDGEVYDVKEFVKSKFNKLVGDVISGNNPELYDTIRDEYFDTFDNISDMREIPTEREFFEDIGVDRMSDIEHEFDLVWPEWKDSGSNTDEEIHNTCLSFERAVGRKFTYSRQYHGAARQPNRYAIEPDGSIEVDGDNEVGLEFVSPPLPLPEMLRDLRNVVNWAWQTGCRTDKSTGLHMNVSIPGFDNDKLDYVKLALFIGDKYILSEFSREYNEYCESALSKIEHTVAINPEVAEAVLSKMKSGISLAASKLIHNGITKKYSSIHIHNGYVEFRSPGGNWLQTDLAKLESTLLRFVIALSVACDPSKYKEEYAKKLYKLLAPGGKWHGNSVEVFSRYSAGNLPKGALKSFIRDIQMRRDNTKKQAVTPAYEVYLTNEDGEEKIIKRFNARTPEEAREWWRSSPFETSAGYGYRLVNTPQFSI